MNAFIALGSNLGDRAQNLTRAVLRLGQLSGTTVSRVSSFRETAAVGGPANQPAYLNGVCALETSLEPRALLRHLQIIEAELGRVRDVKDGPRTLDLDLLLFGDRVIADPSVPLLVPHPRLQDRFFVLDPLREIAPDFRHPVFDRTMSELHNDLTARKRPTPARSLLGLRALVTGSTSGIGRAIALELASAGADVVVHGRRSAEEVTALCRNLGVRSTGVLADLANAGDCRALAEVSWKAFQGLDVVILNAGADTLTGAGARLSFAEKLEMLWNVDVRSTMQLARDFGTRMKDRGQGAIMTMGWDQAETGMEGDSGQLFAATKGAVMAFTRSLALTLAPEVRVNCLAPGWIRTAWGEHASDAWQQRVMRETPLRRWGTPADIAGVAHWLAGPGAEFITGQIIRINGGAVRS